MNKITRMLLLYSKLFRGEKVNKFNFCLETDSLPRTFDRDIEDIRLYLSELLSSEQLVYDRQEKVYYIPKQNRQVLEKTEYLFLERVLLDTSVLRQDEMHGLLSHLASNTENIGVISFHEKEAIRDYKEPFHENPILKMHGDLTSIIKSKSVIKVHYAKMDGTMIERILIPCMVRYDSGYLYLIGFHQEDDRAYAAYYRLDRIYSFSVIRKQHGSETKRVEEYIRKYADGITQMYGGDFQEIYLLCKKEFYPYIHDKFRTASIMNDNGEMLTVKIKAFQDGFVKWMLAQPIEFVQVMQPAEIKEKIAEEAKKLVEIYGGMNYGKED